MDLATGSVLSDVPPGKRVEDPLTGQKRYYVELVSILKERQGKSALQLPSFDVLDAPEVEDTEGPLISSGTEDEEETPDFEHTLDEESTCEEELVSFSVLSRVNVSGG